MTLAPAKQHDTVPGHHTEALESLLQRMQTKGDFPALSQSIDTINQLVSTSDESIQTLSSALLKDFALTNKVLRLVNSATYSRFGGTISTISRAVMILGFNAVRSLAITLTLFEHMQRNTQSVQLKENMLAAYFTGILAFRIAAASGIPDSEEGFICGVFHRLGRLMAIYYFHEESLAIDMRLQQNETEDKASRAVLGVSFEEFGIGVARQWHLPEKIVNSIQCIDGPRIQKSANQGDKLRLVANLATALCRVASECPAERKDAEIEKLRREFGTHLSLGKTQFSDALDDSIGQFLAESEMFVAESDKSPLLGFIKQRQISRCEDAPAALPDTATNMEKTLIPTGVADPRASPVSDTVAVPGADDGAVLAAGIQDITNALVGDYNLNDLLCIILETMYRGMGFSQVLLCTRDLRLPELRARLGFGTETENLLKYFHVPIGQAHDVFQLSLNKNADIFIANTRSDSVINRIPAWYRDKVNATAFLLLPIVIKNKIFGLFYASYDQTGDFVIEPHLLQMLKTLRNQAILAIRQQS
ncbi:MAG: HDOD domain-containing protein [Burkholderiales bacterium]